MKRILTLGLSSVILAACSQPPAPVAHKGDRFYGKDGVTALAQLKSPEIPPQPSGFVASNEPARQEAPAPVESIEVAELSAPEPVQVTQPQPQPVFQEARYEPAVAKQTAPEMIDVEAPQLEPLPMDEIASMPQNPVQKAIKEERKQPVLAKSSSTFIWPVEGKIVSHFGPKKNGLVNDGINISAGEGEPIWSAASGEVVYAGNELKGYGNMMIIRHANGWMTAYAHASDMLINKGDHVEQGDLIGYVGKTGAVQSAQLHFGIREGKTPVNPETLLPRRVASAQ